MSDLKEIQETKPRYPLMRISCKSQLMHFSFRPDTCPFWISTSPGQCLQLIALGNSMDLRSRKDGVGQGGETDLL